MSSPFPSLSLPRAGQPRCRAQKGGGGGRGGGRLGRASRALCSQLSAIKRIPHPLPLRQNQSEGKERRGGEKGGKTHPGNAGAGGGKVAAGVKFVPGEAAPAFSGSLEEDDAAFCLGVSHLPPPTHPPPPAPPLQSGQEGGEERKIGWDRKRTKGGVDYSDLNIYILFSSDQTAFFFFFFFTPGEHPGRTF